MDRVDDDKIVELYWKRLEQAITETKLKYENYLFVIANNVLRNQQDSEECYSDCVKI